MKNLFGCALLASIYGGVAWAIWWAFEVDADRALLITILIALAQLRWHQGGGSEAQS